MGFWLVIYKRYDDVFDSRSDYYGEDGGVCIFITFIFIIVCGMFSVIYNLLVFFWNISHKSF